MRPAKATAVATTAGNLTTTPGDVALHVPRLMGISSKTAIIERYRRRESSAEEVLIEMYLAGVSVRRVDVPTDFDTIEKALSRANAAEKGLK